MIRRLSNWREKDVICSRYSVTHKHTVCFEIQSDARHSFKYALLAYSTGLLSKMPTHASIPWL